jgi:hypothetical protein
MGVKAKEILDALRALEGREISVRPEMCWPGKCFLCTEVVQAVVTENGRGIPVVTLKADSGDGWTFRARDIGKIGDWWDKAIVLTDKQYGHTGVFYDWPLKDGRDYPVHSPLPSHHTDPSEMRKIAREHQARHLPDRRECPPLPWTMRELVGSGWCNVYTGGYARVLALVEDCSGEPLLQNCEGVGWNHIGLGLWWKDRYVVENWARVDHLPPGVRLAWFAEELEHRRRDESQRRQALAHLDDNSSRVSCYRANRNAALRAVRQAQEEVERTVREMCAYAQEHSLEVTTELLNAGTEHQTGPAQMRLL